VYPPELARDGDAYDFGDGSVLHQYARASQRLMRSRATLPEYVFLARAEIGLYSALTRLRARVHTSAIVRKYLRKQELTTDAPPGLSDRGRICDIGNAHHAFLDAVGSKKRWLLAAVHKIFAYALSSLYVVTVD
jgi:hypothetical protein